MIKYKCKDCVCECEPDVSEYDDRCMPPAGPTGGTGGVIWTFPEPEENKTEEPEENKTEETTEHISGGCLEDWECSGWSDCFEGTQIRGCADLNKCGTENEKPSEVQACEVVEEGGEEPELPTGLFALTPEEIGGASLFGLIVGSLIIWFFSRRRGR